MGFAEFILSLAEGLNPSYSALVFLSRLVIAADFFYLALAHDFDRQRRRVSLRLVVDERLIGFLQIS